MQTDQQPSLGMPGRPAQTERFEVIVIGGGQAGLSTGYHLARRGLRFVILDAEVRVGDAWRKRWDSLRLFSPARFDGLDGMPFPAPEHAFPTKDEMADYLEAYAARFQLPVRSGVKVDRLWKSGQRYVVQSRALRFEADQVVVATANYHHPEIPDFSSQLSPEIVQLHSSAYRNPSQLRPGGVLIVGAGNSGAEIANELARSHPTWISGPDIGQVPFRHGGWLARLFLTALLFRFVFHRLLSLQTPLGRKLRPKLLHGSAPLIRIKNADLRAAGVERVPRVIGMRNGLPLLQDQRVLEVANLVWCTGYRANFGWIELPIFDASGDPLHDAGVVRDARGLYFVGLNFLYAMSSAMIHGVGRDAARIAAAASERARQPSAGPSSQLLSLATGRESAISAASLRS